MPVHVIPPRCHGNSYLCASQNEFSLEKLSDTSRTLGIEPLLPCITADPPKLPLVLARFRKHVHTHTYRAHAYINIYTHPHTHMHRALTLTLMLVAF